MSDALANAKIAALPPMAVVTGDVAGRTDSPSTGWWYLGRW